MKKLTALFTAALILAGVWLLLTASPAADELIVGGFVLVLTLVVFGKSALIFGGVKIGPKLLIMLPVYLFVFLMELIKSNLDVARRVLSPSLPVNPGIVKVKTELKSDIGRLLLANSITLTPGTLTLDVIDDELYVHWIDVKDKSLIGRRFERIAKEIVE